MTTFKRIPFHPFLFGIYAILAMLATNIGQLEVTTAFRSLVLVPLGIFILLLLLKVVYKDWIKAAILTSLLVVLFFSFGHVYLALEEVYLFGEPLGRYRYLGPLWIVIILLGAWWLSRSRRNLTPVNQVLNTVGLVALIFPVIQIVTFGLQTPTIGPEEEVIIVENVGSPSIADLHVPEGEIPPDIYYIILDMYVRNDVLKEIFHFDNSPFLDRLTEMDFYVAGCSQSNYTDTPLSLASSFNVAYLESFAKELVSRNLDHYRIEPYVRNSLVLRALKDLGYTIVNIESGFFLSEWRDADIYLSGNVEASRRIFTFGGLNEFEGMLLQSTVGKWIYDNRPSLPAVIRPYLDQPYIERRDQILYALDALKDLASIEGPKFVFVHIVAPHPPFVFGPNGEFVIRNTPLTLNFDLEDREWERYVPGYRGQVVYLNNRFETILEAILQQSPRSPIIVLQSDHGITRVSSTRERVAILNAYHLPDGGNESLYPSITPVNTFRVILNHYFGGNFDLLEDVSYLWEKDKGPYEFEVVPSMKDACQE